MKLYFNRNRIILYIKHQRATTPAFKLIYSSVYYILAKVYLNKTYIQHINKNIPLLLKQGQTYLLKVKKT